jgi:hypothetical protein
MRFANNAQSQKLTASEGVAGTVVQHESGFLNHLELCWPANHAVEWCPAFYGYCMSCGVKINPYRLGSDEFTYLCTGCEKASERWLLSSAIHQC